MKKAIMALLALSAFDSVQANPTGQELLINGDFAENDCNIHHHYCLFKTSTYVKGWTPIPDGQIGFGSLYNQRLGKERVIELATTKNVCIAQTVKNLQPGIYQLKYNYAARDYIPFKDCEFQVRFNDREVRRITPGDYHRNTDIIEIEVKDQCDGQVKFCGLGPQHWYGALLGPVSFIRKSDLPNSRPPVIYPGQGQHNHGIGQGQQNQRVEQGLFKLPFQGSNQGNNQPFDSSQTSNNQVLNPAFNSNANQQGNFGNGFKSSPFSNPQRESNLRNDFYAPQNKFGPANFFNQWGNI